jgi:hypothetical protein
MLKQNTIRTALVLAACGGALALVSAAAAQPAGTPPATSTPAPSATPTFRSTGDARRDTLVRMSKHITLEVTDQKLEDVITFIRDFTGADIDTAWQGENGSTPGLDKERKITISIKNRPAMDAVEAVLAKAKPEFGSENAWQLTPQGSLQIGPKEALNKEKRVVVYDIHDLLFTINTYTDVPEIDLNSVLQQSQGGGGGTSPFRDQNRNQNQNTKTRDERTKEIVDLITTLIEPDQWRDNGGEGGSVTAYNGTLLVNAPDYMHRQINGYPFWSSYNVTKVNGHRYVALNMDTGISKVNGFGTQPVTAVVPGGGGRSGGPGGGGK